MYINIMTHLNHNFQFHQCNNLVIIWQAKAACTIVNKMYYEEEGLLEEAEEYSNWIHDYREKHNIETHIIRNKGLNSKSTKYIHFVVNPYRRIVSSYIHAMRTNYTNWSNISFRHFVQLLSDDTIIYNSHHGLQLSYLHTKKQIEYIKMENIEHDLPVINKKYGLNYSMKTSLHHAVTHEVDDKFIGDMVWNDIEKIPRKYSNFYSETIKDIVTNIFEHDINIFGYTWDEFINNE
jgi:hypothetical protein